VWTLGASTARGQTMEMSGKFSPFIPSTHRRSTWSANTPGLPF
jgi:hypothetical protein